MRKSWSVDLFSFLLILEAIAFFRRFDLGRLLTLRNSQKRPSSKRQEKCEKAVFFRFSEQTRSRKASKDSTEAESRHFSSTGLTSFLSSLKKVVTGNEAATPVENEATSNLG